MPYREMYLIENPEAEHAHERYFITQTKPAAESAQRIVYRFLIVSNDSEDGFEDLMTILDHGEVGYDVGIKPATLE